MIHHPDWIGSHIDRYGYYERGMLEYIKALKIGGTYFDIGANIGNHSVYFAKECGVKVVAFEPVKENYDMLIQNVAGLPVECHPFAIGASGHYTYDIKPKNMGAIALKRDKTGGDIVPLDRFAHHKPTLLKIDVEGMEYDVIRTAREIISQCRPHVFIETDDLGEALYQLKRYRKIAKFRPYTYHLAPA